MKARRLPTGWTPPSNVIDIGQLPLALLTPPQSTRSLTFVADEHGAIRIKAVAP